MARWDSRATEVGYVWEQIVAHARRFLTDEAVDALSGGRVALLPWPEAVRRRGPAVALPVDVPAPLVPSAPWRVPFGETHLTLCNRLPNPDGPGWTPVPDPLHPLWHRHASGTLLPAWNLMANLFDLLVGREDRQIRDRDAHGRFTAASSPRLGAGLLEVPAVNEAAAALAAACTGLRQGGTPRTSADGLVRRTAVVLSHDNDILRGNDRWTQGVRCWRIFQPLLHRRPPQLSNAWWIVRNAVAPRTFYMDNVAGMAEVERMLSFRSAFYFLNGTGGRFGARNGTTSIRAALSVIPDGWDVGMHYNYDTFLDADRFAAQKRELEHVIGRTIDVGRGHYLRFDPERFFLLLEQAGIRCDETGGYPDRVGYRFGIAGPFRPYNRSRHAAMDLWELPLMVQDGTLLDQYREDPAHAFRRMLTHLTQLGGALSLLFHPGVFHNPEVPAALRLYRRLLGIARSLGAEGVTARSLLA